MMRSTWKRTLSVLLTIVMVAGLLVVPASAEEGVYEVNFDENSVENDYFTANGGTGVTSRERTITEGTGEGAVSYASTYAYRFGGATKTGEFKTARSVSFTTTYPNATIKLWFENSSSGGRELAIWNSSGALNPAVQTESLSATSGVEELELGAAGTYYIVAPTGDLYIHKIVVVDKAPAASDDEITLTFDVGEGLSVTDLTVGGTDTTYAASVNVAKNAAVTFKVASEDADVYEVNEVKFGETVLTDADGVYTIADVGADNATVTITVNSSRVAAESVTISGAPTEALTVGDTVALTAAVEPESTTDKLDWTTSNDKVATVSDGTVTAVAIGKATITAAAGEKSDTCDVTVVGADQEGPVYTFTADNMGVQTLPTTAMKYDNYFTLTSGSTASSVVAGAVTIDGTSFTNQLKFSKTSALTFTTTAEKSTVELWWKQNKDAGTRDILLDTITADAADTVVDKDGVTASSVANGGFYHATFSEVASGTHTFKVKQADGEEYIYQVVVTEEESSEEETKVITFDVPTGAELAELKVGTEAATLTEGKLTVAKDAVVTFTVTVTDTTKELKSVTGAEASDGTFTVNADATTVTITLQDKAPTVDKTALNTALAAAKAIDTTAVEVSAAGDGSDVFVDKQWVTQAVKTALTDAISNGETIAAKADATEEEVTAATTALTTATANWQPAAGTKLKTMTVTATGYTDAYDGNAHGITVTVTEPATGATVEYSDAEDGTYSATPITITNVNEGPKTVWYQVTADGYETVKASATITITKKAAPNIVVNADLKSGIAAEGEDVTFTATGVPEGTETALVGTCTQAGEGVTINFELKNGKVQGVSHVAENTTNAAKTHDVTFTWSDDNYETPTIAGVSLTQVKQGDVSTKKATGVKAWPNGQYDKLGVTTDVDGNQVALSVDEVKILAAYAADPDTFKGTGMKHGDNAYMMIQFDAPAGVTEAYTVKQTVNGGAEGDPWKLDGTSGDLDCWTEDGKLVIGDWFCVLTNVDATPGMPATGTYELVYNFYDGTELKAAVTYTVDRQVVNGATITLAGTDLATQKVNGEDYTAAVKVSPADDLEIVVTAATGKVLPETVTVTGVADGDYTWDQATGKLTIAAGKLTSGLNVTVTIAAGDPAPTEYTVTVNGGTADKAKAAEGASVKVTANAPETGKVFDKWTTSDLTLSETDAAKAELTFTMPAKNVTLTATYKAQGGENPPAEDGYILTADALNEAGLTTFAAGSSTKVGKDDFFTIHAKASGDSTVGTVPGAVASAGWADGYKGQYRIKWGGTTMTAEGDAANISSVIEFTATGAGTAKVWFINNESTNVALFKENTAEAVAISEAYTVAKNEAGVATVQIPEAGTYYLGFSKDKTPSKGETCKVQVIIGGAGETVDKTALEAAITAAEALADVVGSADGKDVETTKEWVETAKREALDTALTEAKALGDDATQEQVTAAAEKLAAAVKDVTDNKKAGTKTETPVEADKTALKAAIKAAQAQLDAAKTSADGADVLKTDTWLTAAAKTKLTADIKTAQDVADKKAATQTEVEDAVTALEAAVAAADIKAGTKAVTAADLKAAIDAANTAAEDITVDTDAANVKKGEEFVTQAVKDAYLAAIAEAQKVADNTEADADALEAALAELNEATAAFNAAKQEGTKATRPIGGGSSSSSTPVTTTKTETKADGTTVTTTTDKNGATTVVTKRPDGMETTTVTDKNGDMTITTVNDKDEVVAEVKIPATIPANPQKFVDVPEGHWAEGSINHMAALEMVKGVDDANHIFDMNSAITRGAVATILYRFSNGEKGLSQNFSDVAKGQWYTDAVAWASKAGVVTGYENGTFQPNGSITREQLAVMIYRYAKIIGLDISEKGSLSTFTDGVKVQSWAADGMAWCVQNGIINGRGDGTVDPGTPATRAEAAAMLDRFVSLLK